MHSPCSPLDPAELYLSQLGTDHSRATARSALRTVARALGVESIDWASLTYADFARVRAGLGRLSVPWGNACLSVLRRCAVEGRRVGVLDAALVDDVLSLPRLRGTSGRLGRDIDSDEIQALFDACDPDTAVGRRDRALYARPCRGLYRRGHRHRRRARLDTRVVHERAASAARVIHHCA